MKKFNLILGILILSAIASGQSQPNVIITETNPDLSDDLEYVFQNLDLSGITSGLLLDKAGT